MKRGTPDHPKTAALEAMLGISKAETCGLLELLWHWTARYAPAGDVGRWPNEAIAVGMGWKGDPDTLIDALVKLRWLDVHKTCRLAVHDWFEHAEDAVHMTLARNTERFACGNIPRMHRFKKEQQKKLREAFDAHPVRTRRARRVKTDSTLCALPSHPIPTQPNPSHNTCDEVPAAHTVRTKSACPISAPTGAATQKPAAEVIANKPAAWSSEAGDDWNERFGKGSADFGKIGRYLKPIVDANGWDTIRPAWRRYLAETRHIAPNPKDFQEHWANWLPGAKGASKPNLADRSRAVIGSWEPKGNLR